MTHGIVIAALLALGPTARAEDPKVAAKEHIGAAKVLHAQHRYGEAVGELETAYALDPNPQLLFALGQLHVQLRRCERAIAFYTRFLTSKPRREQAAIAREAIAACKVAPTESLELVSEPAPPSLPVRPPQAAEPRDAGPRTPRPWYGNYLADGFVIAGVVSAIGSIIAYRAEARTASIALGVGGGLAIAGGGLGIALQRRF